MIIREILMKEKLDFSTISNEDGLGGYASSFLSISPLVLPLADHLVRQLVDYQAFDAQLAFSNLDLN